MAIKHCRDAGNCGYGLLACCLCCCWHAYWPLTLSHSHTELRCHWSAHCILWTGSIHFFFIYIYNIHWQESWRMWQEARSKRAAVTRSNGSVHFWGCTQPTLQTDIGYTKLWSCECALVSVLGLTLICSQQKSSVSLGHNQSDIIAIISSNHNVMESNSAVLTEEVNIILQLNLPHVVMFLDWGGQTVDIFHFPPLLRATPGWIWGLWRKRCGAASADTGVSPHWCSLCSHPKWPHSIPDCPSIIRRSHPLLLLSEFVYFLPLYFL